MAIAIKSLTRQQKIAAGGFGAAVVLVAVVGVGVVAVNSSNSPGDQPAPVASPVPTVTLTAEEQAVTEAKEAYARFIRVDDEISHSLTGSLDAYDSVLVSGALVDGKHLAEEARKKGLYITGNASIVSMEPTKASILYEPNANPKRIPFVNLRVCQDVKAQRIVNSKTGETTPLTPPRRSRLFTVSNVTGQLDDLGSWKVSLVGDDVTPC